MVEEEGEGLMDGGYRLTVIGVAPHLDGSTHGPGAERESRYLQAAIAEGVPFHVPFTPGRRVPDQQKTFACIRHVEAASYPRVATTTSWTTSLRAGSRPTGPGFQFVCWPARKRRQTRKRRISRSDRNASLQLALTFGQFGLHQAARWRARPTELGVAELAADWCPGLGRGSGDLERLWRTRAIGRLSQWTLRSLGGGGVRGLNGVFAFDKPDWALILAWLWLRVRRLRALKCRCSQDFESAGGIYGLRWATRCRTALG